MKLLTPTDLGPITLKNRIAMDDHEAGKYGRIA